MIIIIALVDIWGIASIIDFLIYTIDCHKWNMINVFWKLIGKHL